MRKKKPRNNVKLSKLFIVGSLFLFILMISRVVFLGLSKNVDGVDLQALASRRTTKTDTIKAKRGTISTKEGEVLAQNVSSYKLIAYLDEKRTTNKNKPQHVVDKDLTAEKLAPILGISKEEILTYLNKTSVYQTEFGSKGKGLTELTKEKIEALNLPGLDFEESFKRYYPKGDFLSYIIGYAKEDNDTSKLTGEMGLEKYYDKTLSGTDGYTTYQKDLRGYKIAGTKEVSKKAEDGNNIYLTINNNIQFFVEQALDEAEKETSFEWFTIVVADANTGAILAASSSPSFDPNKRNLTNYLDLNIALPYEPGSTMKIFTYMAAMEKGDITFDKGFALSSNVGVINLIKRHMNADMLRSYFKKLGFSKKTGITLPNEATGKLSFKYETEIFNAGFGQGITTTPMQNIQALTSLTNKGTMLKPYIVDKIVDSNTNEVVYEGKRTEVDKVASEETVNKMKDLMWDTVNGKGNTGAGYRLEGYDLIGKTGTAQIADESSGGYLSGSNDIISSFAGVYPKENSKVIIYASVKRPAGGKQNVIWKAVKDIVVNISKYYGTNPTDTTVSKLKTYTLNSYTNKTVEEDKTDLTKKGMEVVQIGNGNKVISQYPNAKEKVASGSKVFLITNDSNQTMPDLVGLSRKQAEELLKRLDVTVTLDGSGYVTEQSVAVGTKIEKGMNVTLKLAKKF